MLGGGDDDSFCDTIYMSSSKKQAIHDLLNIDIYLLIQVTTQCAFGSQVREAVSVGARGVIFYDPTGDYITNPIPQVNRKRKRENTIPHQNNLPSQSTRWPFPCWSLLVRRTGKDSHSFFTARTSRYSTLYANWVSQCSVGRLSLKCCTSPPPFTWIVSRSLRISTTSSRLSTRSKVSPSELSLSSTIALN